MINKTNIIRLVVALMLILSMMLSLTSCVLDFSYFFDFSEFEDGSEEEGGGNGGNGGQGDQGGEGNNGDEITSENYGDYYPGSGQGDISSVNVLNKTLLSTVSIVAEFGSSSLSGGSGVIYSVDKEKGDAYIITNYHVVYNNKAATKISVYLYGMELAPYAIPAILVGGSTTYDIAVLKITGNETIKNSYAIAATIADSDNVRVFDRVYAVGNAEGAGISATEGIVSVDSESLDISGADGSLVSLRVMRTDAAVNHGNSGGGLFDNQGRLIGIVSAKEVSEDIDNMGYAIPSTLAIKVANNILATCNGADKTTMRKALMGVTITSYVIGVEIEDNGDMYKVQLVEVTAVNEGSISDGKMKVGDIINSITVDGVKQEVTRMHHVTDAMIDARLGSKVVINVTRGGESMDISFTVTAAEMTDVK